MPFKVRLIEQGAILLVRAVGAADPGDWFALGEQTSSLGPSPRAVIIDLRARETLPTADQARETGRGLAGVATDRFDAVALVARPGAQFGLARMVALLSELENLSTAVFEEPGPALAWVRKRFQDGAAGGP